MGDDRNKITEMWAVASGEYSDYGIDAICGDRETAEAWAKAMNESADTCGSDHRVESIEFVPAGVEPFQVTHYTRHAELYDSGKLVEHDMRVDVEWAVGSYMGIPPSRPHVRFVRAPVYQDKGGRLEVRGASEEAVNKVFSERVAAWKAGGWITRDLREWTNDTEDDGPVPVDGGGDGE
jgi:hypothetical protein